MQPKRRLALAALTVILPTLGIAGESLMRQNQTTTQAQVSRATLSYQSAGWNTLVSDSYNLLGNNTRPFSQWLEAAYRGTTKAHLGKYGNLEEALQFRKAELKAAKGEARVILERKTGAWLHKMTKAIIPKFSLERGFEFVYMVKNGERQCLLQSVLIAALAQRMGMDVGIAMVWRNDTGRVSNLGHVTAVVRLSNGLDTLIDASDPEPFFKHQGLLMRDGSDYRFLEPQYDKNGNILEYKRTKDGVNLKPRQVESLSYNYIRSQFEFYRGERAVGGFIGPSTPSGLAESALHLTKAIGLEPANALALYVLALVERKQEKPYRARLEQAAALYERYGFMPEGVKTALAQAQ